MLHTTIADARDRFNEGRDAVRLVTLLSPTCLVCQYGAGIVRGLFDVADEPGLRGTVGWIPMMNADSREAATREATTFGDPRCEHAWDGERRLSDAFARTLGLRGRAWDVYLLYAPGAAWAGDDPPAPTFWMHQLSPAMTAAPADRLLAPATLVRSLWTLLGRDPEALAPDLALMLHAKGLDAVRRERGQPSLEDVMAAAVPAR